MDFQTIAATAMSILTPIGAAAIAGVRWVIKQLEECKAKHSESLNKIDGLHVQLRDLSEEVGNMRGQLSVYQQNQEDIIDEAHKHQ